MMDETLCCIADCGMDTHARHFCQRHYTRWLRHGHPLSGEKAMRGQPDTAEQRLLAKRRVTESGCWEWTGHLEHHGYGRTTSKSRRVYTHRLAYEVWRGPIPNGLAIDHLCRNRACFNPDHLEAVTVAENNRRSSNGRATHCRNGHEYTPENTAVRRKDGCRVCRECRRAYERAKRRRAKAVA